MVTPLDIQCALPEWLETCLKLEKQGRAGAALDILYDRMDRALSDGEFDECDRLLHDLRPSDLSLTLILGILTITLAASSRLQSRAGLLASVRASLTAERPDADQLLAGL